MVLLRSICLCHGDSASVPSSREPSILIWPTFRILCDLARRRGSTSSWLISQLQLADILTSLAVYIEELLEELPGMRKATRGLDTAAGFGSAGIDVKIRNLIV